MPRRLAVAAALGLIVSPAHVHAAPRSTPEAAMRSFLVSVWTLDRDAFLSHFSKSRPHYVSSYVIGINRKPISYQELARDIRARTGLYCDYMLDCNGEDVLADEIVSNRDDAPARLEMWLRDGVNRFRPRSGGTPIGWRKEGGAWVVDEIGAWNEPRQ